MKIYINTHFPSRVCGTDFDKFRYSKLVKALTPSSEKRKNNLARNVTMLCHGCIDVKVKFKIQECKTRCDIDYEQTHK